MFNFLKRNKEPAVLPEETLATSPLVEPGLTATEPQAKPSLFRRLKEGLQKTRKNFSEGIANLILGKKQIDTELLEDLETLLLTADIGVAATQAIIADLALRVKRKQLADPTALYQALQTDLTNLLKPCQQPLLVPPDSPNPYVILMVGVNGAGKTTTIGKLTQYLQQQGKRVMLAAGDTFRAAAIEQLQVWGERNQVPVIAQKADADSAAVIFDALQAARARKIDVLIADTAGRLHTKDNLMAELQKVKRVLAKLDPNAPHETMLVLDAGTGQNGLIQAQQFHEALSLTSISLTKLDGTAKGGVIFAIANKLGLPIRFIGIGEGINDLRPFNAAEFVQALFDQELHSS